MLEVTDEVMDGVPAKGDAGGPNWSASRLKTFNTEKAMGKTYGTPSFVRETTALLV